MILVLLLEIGVGIVAYEKSDLLEDAVEQSLRETLDSTKTDDTLIFPWNKLQSQVFTHSLVFK